MRNTHNPLLSNLIGHGYGFQVAYALGEIMNIIEGSRREHLKIVVVLDLLLVEVLDQPGQITLHSAELGGQVSSLLAANTVHVFSIPAGLTRKNVGFVRLCKVNWVPLTVKRWPATTSCA